MKKIYSLIKACMTSDMNLFKIKTKNNNKSSNLMIYIVISFLFMFTIWSNANILFEKMAPLHLQTIVLSMFVFAVSIMTIIEGIYKSSSLIFNSRDDDLLLSLPIQRKTIVFIRIFKFYVFELLFNSLFIIPLIIAYLRWAENLNITFFLTSFIMIFTLPIIPIAISCIIGAFISSLSSRFKYKNIVETVITMGFLLIVLYISFNIDNIYNYVVQNATSINDIITKIYYPAGLYAKLTTNFNLLELMEFILINIVILLLTILILSKFYFAINSRLKNVTTIKKVKIDKLKIKSKSIYLSLIKKELNTFFSTPVFIINAGFGLVLFIVACIIIVFKYDSFIFLLNNINESDISFDFITNNTSILILILISFTSFMTSITNSLISLEGKNINILKSLPIETKTILTSKILSCLFITTPVLIIGDIILFIKFKINIISIILLLILSILIPLVSHFIGLIINLKYPKLDFENSTEVVKQSTSSFLSVMIGMLLFVISMVIIINVVSIINPVLTLLLATTLYLIIDIILYLYLINKGSCEFNSLSI